MRLEHGIAEVVEQNQRINCIYTDDAKQFTVNLHKLMKSEILFTQWYVGYTN